MRLGYLIFVLLIEISLFGQPKKAPYEFEATKIDVGKVKVFKTAKAEFKFKNVSDKPLIITSATGSCGCVEVRYPTKPILPGAEAKIVVTFRPYTAGRFRKFAIVQFDTEPPYDRQVLVIKGDAVQ